MDNFKQGIEKHHNLYRVLCFLISLITLGSLILSMFMTWAMWLFVGMTVLYFVAFTPLIILNKYNRLDYILYSIMILQSLLIAAVASTAIIDVVFHNTDLNLYFGITLFFTFSYLYDMYFREISKSNEMSLLSLLLTDSLRGFHAMSARAAVGISRTCNIFRLALLVLSIFDKQYSLLNESVKNLPITDAIVTSLAVEKLIKSFYSKLGTKVDISNQGQ